MKFTDGNLFYSKAIHNRVSVKAKSKTQQRYTLYIWVVMIPQGARGRLRPPRNFLGPCACPTFLGKCIIVNFKCKCFTPNNQGLARCTQNEHDAYRLQIVSLVFFASSNLACKEYLIVNFQVLIYILCSYYFPSHHRPFTSFCHFGILPALIHCRYFILQSFFISEELISIHKQGVSFG